MDIAALKERHPLAGVTADEDEDADNDTVTLTHSVSGYGTVTSGDDVIVTIVERDEEGITVTDVMPQLEDPNDGDTPAVGTYTVVLDTQPTGDVKVAIDSNNPDVTVMPEELTFTTTDWNQPKPESTDRSLRGRDAGLPERSAGVAALAGRCRGRTGARSRRSARLGGAEGAGARVREACAGMLARASEPGRRCERASGRER